MERRSWCGWWTCVVWVVVWISAHPAKLWSLGCPGSELPQDLAVLTALVFEDWNGVACVAPDQNLDARISAPDLIQQLHYAVNPPRGPVVTFLGLATADGRLLEPAGRVNGLPIYQRSAGSGFQLVVEGRAGASTRPPGITTFQPDRSGTDGRPDLQMLASRPLGDGSPEVCIGGVPAVVPPDFRPERFVSDALNDLGCNFSLSSLNSCVVNAYGMASFAVPGSQIQFCATVARTLAFPPGDTVVTVRLRDTSGNVGSARQVLVRIGEVVPTPTALPQTPTASPTRVPETKSPTATVAAPPSPTPTATTPRALTPTATRTLTATASQTSAPTRTPSATGTASASTRSATASRTPTRSASATFTPSRTATLRLASQTATGTRTPTRTFTAVPTTLAPTRTRTRTPTSTPTSASSAGPIITFIGITRADDTLVDPVGVATDGTPIYERPTGAGFNIVVEGRPGPSSVAVGTVTFRENGPPDLQVLVSRPLGDGSPEVCDRLPPRSGGVPAIDPPVFGDAPEVIAAMNDLGCRFLDGGGQPRGRGKNDACVLQPDGGFDFVRSNSTVQFCGFIDVATRFPAGEVRVTVRLRDESGQTGESARIILRIQS
ncbi:MAG: hypothetical protein KatS3mg077_1979 [Candidatus Binatia bacterium]|nr:MAG: hypothetical protein KatS3mg077_1979 [Candidatus Binatia bacterium]